MADLLADLPADYEPKVGARKLVRDKLTGDLGYLVKRSGKLMVRLDRPNQEILKRYSEDGWQDEETQRPLAPIHAAKVAFEADRALCAALSMHEHAKKDWSKLSDGERHKWLSQGPVAPLERTALYRAVMDILKPFTRG